MQVDRIKFGPLPNILQFFISLRFNSTSIKDRISDAETDATVNRTNDPEEKYQQEAIDAAHEHRTSITTAAAAE